jgi:molybdopterin-biosynthesis enzyme MoeA-like protein
VVERIVLGCYESDVAQDLASVHDRHGLVSVGSYPRDEDGRDVVLVTLESRSGAAAAAALEDLLHRLPAGVVLRVESEGLRS